MAATGMTPEEVWQRLRRNWGFDCAQPPEDRERTDWFEIVAMRRAQLETYATAYWSGQSGAASKAELIVLVADAEPMVFLAGFWAGVLAGWTVALANPNWANQEWQATHHLITPQIIWSTSTPPIPLTPLIPPTPHSPPFHSTELTPKPTPRILIPTGGTSGQLKFAHHTWTTLTTAATGFQRHFQSHSRSSTPINAYCVLPLYHVSGLMQALRVWLTHGQLIILPFKTLLSPIPSWRLSGVEAHTFLSLVPTQLSRLITAKKSPWLRQFHAILLGGAPSWPDLLDQAVEQKLPICLTYGMTETGAMVSAMQPQDFVQSFSQGKLSSGRPMPHAAIRIEHQGKPLPVGEIGQIVVTSGAIARGYHNATSPNFTPSFKGQTLYTDDLGYLDDDGRLHITGRASSKIISGGENIFPDEVETALRSTGQVLSVCVVGRPDTDWGEVVTAAYVPAHLEVSIDSLKAALDSKGQLSRYKYPKRWFALDSLPENAQGKVNRPRLQTLLDQLSSQSGSYR
ncbi:MAG: AMP-binding protein [Cyanobacteria bacterium P01_D01_bin.1]